MNSKYNVLITYKGDGEFKFTVKKIGEVSITSTKPVYIYNADVDVIDSLRILRRLLIEITIGAKPTGAYKVYNLDDYDKKSQYMQFAQVDSRGVNKTTVTNSDISSILSNGTSGPIEIEETTSVQTEEPKEEVKTTTSKRTTNKKKRK